MKTFLFTLLLLTLGFTSAAKAEVSHIYCYPNSATPYDSTCSAELYGRYPLTIRASSSDEENQTRAAAHELCVSVLASGGLEGDPLEVYCTSCTSGHHLEFGNPETCIPCSRSGCAACTSATSCSSCVAGYYLSTNGGPCQRCPTGCTSCSSATSCSACESGYILVGGKCQPRTVSTCPDRMTKSSDGCCCINK